jgi:hypothetical protein
MEQVIAKTKSVVSEFIQKGLELRRRAKYNVKRRQLWNSYPEKMCNMEAANYLEHLLDTGRYCSSDNYMCIVAKHSRTTMNVPKKVRDRLIGIIEMEIHPHGTLYAYQHSKATNDGDVKWASSHEFITNTGIPFYRELVKKIRHVNGFALYLKPYTKN